MKMKKVDYIQNQVPIMRYARSWGGNLNRPEEFSNKVEGQYGKFVTDNLFD
jgi:hypothetical protein